jgi:tetratricopeptide (TPR) repeat protein
MNALQIFMLSIFVSFLAIRPAYAVKDEFDLFEEDPKTTIQPKKNITPMSLEELKAAFRKEPQKIQLVEAIAIKLHESGDSIKATKLLWKFVEKLSDSGILKLAEIEFTLKNYEQSIKAATLATGLNPKNAKAYSLLGRAQKLKLLNAESLESFKAAITANPKYEEPYWELVKYYEAKNNLYEVRILVQDLIDAQGPKKETLNKMCEINYRDDSFEAAVQSCRDAILKDPKSPDPVVYLGLALIATGQKNAGAKDLKTSADSFKNSELAQFNYAAYLQTEKNHIEATKYFKSCVASDEKSARCWLGFGTEAFEIQKYDESLIALSKACRLVRFEAATQIRKSIITLRASKDIDLLRKFETASERCQFQ